MIKMCQLFSGVGCTEQALKNLGIEHISTQCEIDKYAIDTYNQLHGQTPNLGDISKVNPNDLYEGQWDLITYSFPCQSISLAGKQEGLAKGTGTESSLLWECEKIIRKVKPKWLLMENVKNLLSKKFKPQFDMWLKLLREMGYTNYYHVLNSKDFLIPQNRERVFCVSILGDDNYFEFPQKQPLKLRLKDMLEDSVDEKYYIKKELTDKFVKDLKNKQISNSIRVGGKDSTDQKHSWNLVADKDSTEIQQIGNLYNSKNRDNPQRGRVYSTEGIAPACNTCQGGGLQAHIIEPWICASRGRYNEQGKTEQQLEINKESTSNTITTVSKDNLVIEPMVEEKQERLSKQAYETLQENDCKDGDIINPFNKKVTTDGICPTITTRPEGFKTANLVVKEEIHNFRIRKLTVRECWRLMGWKDEQFDKIKGISNAQLYKQAGNGIVVTVLEAIFRQMFLVKYDKKPQQTATEQLELF